MANPTVLFVHGALVRDGAWWWSPTADLLRRDAGIESRALALPSCGETDEVGGLREDAAALRRALDELGSVVLVGHSYGGTVIAEAGPHPAVRNLLLVSSYTPPTGATQGSIMSGEPDPVTIRPDDAGRVELDGYDAARFGARFLQDAEDALERGAWERVTAQDVRAFGTPTTATGWADVDSTALVCTGDRSTSVALQRAHASRATRAIEVPTGHHPFLTRPDLVAAEVEAFLRR
ncbi:alpha/beta fold hydrolase [Curtobacterium sp. L1-20]|uniref:alpha/beta fold hydrolase n=1 Tax=Curtobacterium sp. L1-20 TaxID=3138181 RepID=UPI003B529E87